MLIIAFLLLAVGYWGRWQWAFALAVAAAVTRWIMLHETFGGGWLALQTGVLVALPLVPWSARRAEDALRQELETQQRTLHADVTELRNRIDHLQRATDALTTDTTQLLELYRVTKETAGEVKVAGLFEGLTKMLSTMLSFRAWYLWLVAPATEETLAVEAAWRGGGIHSGVVPLELVTTPPPWQAPLARLLRREPAPRWISRSTAVPALNHETDLAWIPLLSQDRVRGLMVFEDLPEREFDRAQVIAHQVALQLERVLLYEELERLAVSDSLTELPLRRFFLQRLQEELARAQRHHAAGALVMIDLDHFKSLNDTYGHLVGDEVLRRIGTLLKSNVREIDLSARYGGEEFVLYLVDTLEEPARVVAERIRRMVEDYTIQAYDETVHVTVSLGIALFPTHGAVPAELLEHADEALYQAKAGGRNQVMVYGGSGR